MFKRKVFQWSLDRFVRLEFHESVDFLCQINQQRNYSTFAWNILLLTSRYIRKFLFQWLCKEIRLESSRTSDFLLYMSTCPERGNFIEFLFVEHSKLVFYIVRSETLMLEDRSSSQTSLRRSWIVFESNPSSIQQNKNQIIFLFEKSWCIDKRWWTLFFFVDWILSEFYHLHWWRQTSFLQFEIDDLSFWSVEKIEKICQLSHRMKVSYTKRRFNSTVVSMWKLKMCRVNVGSSRQIFSRRVYKRSSLSLSLTFRSNKIFSLRRTEHSENDPRT